MVCLKFLTSDDIKPSLKIGLKNIFKLTPHPYINKYLSAFRYREENFPEDDKNYIVLISDYNESSIQNQIESKVKKP